MKKIIIIEDDSEILEFLKILLEEYYNFSAFSSLDDLYNSNIDINEYDLIITDYLIGNKCSTELIEKYPNQKYLIISGLSSHSKEISLLLNKKNVSFVEKPFSTKDLLDNIKKLIK